MLYSILFCLKCRKVDQELRRILGPDLLSVLCVIAVSAVSIVAVWKVTSPLYIVGPARVGFLVEYNGIDVASCYPVDSLLALLCVV